MCGKSAAHGSTNITRGKIVCSGSLIDWEDSMNFENMNKWRAQSGMDPLQRTTETPTSNTPDPSSSKEAPTATKKDSETSALNREKTRADIEYKQQKATETRLKNAKLRGELIPTNMVVELFALLGHQFQTQYEIAANELVLEVTHKMKISDEIRGEIGEKLTATINAAHKRAIDESKIAVRNIISSVSGAEMEKPDEDDPESEQ